MKAVVQRVKSASVAISEQNYFQEIGKGLLILLGIKTGDSEEDLNFVADKCCNLRIFEDADDKMNRSVKEVSGEMLIISQFTLYGETTKVFVSYFLFPIARLRFADRPAAWYLAPVDVHTQWQSPNGNKISPRLFALVHQSVCAIHN